MATKKRTAAGGEDDKNKLLKQLLQQAIDSGDPDLIELATQAIAKKGKSKPTKGKHGRPAKNRQVNGKSRTGPASFDGNEFNPKEFEGMFTTDTNEIDKKIRMPKQLTPKRDEPEDVQVTCSRCNKTEYIPPSVAIFGETEYYVCNKCGATH